MTYFREFSDFIGIAVCMAGGLWLFLLFVEKALGRVIRVFGFYNAVIDFFWYRKKFKAWMESQVDSAGGIK